MLSLQKVLFRSLKNKIKHVDPEPYVNFQKDTKPHIKMTPEKLKAMSKIYTEKNAKRIVPENFVPIPVSPALGPIELKKPEVGEKYMWCSCGMSLSQPLCDGSHNKTSFKPLVFMFEEPCHSAHMCGCKYSKEKPFCDRKTCLTLTEYEMKDHEK